VTQSTSSALHTRLEIEATNDDVAAPAHVAVIMDGNGRWAQARGLPRTMGHKEGAEALRRCVKAARAQGIRHLTVFGFSSENWKRPRAEVGDLMGLLRLYLRREIDEIDRNGVRLRVIGERERLPGDINAMIIGAEARTEHNQAMELIIALSYGGRSEIVRAARALARSAQRGDLDPLALDEAAFERQLFTAGMPDPDLVIRTSGEKRISNFLLWQCAYSEFVFMDKLWPDFVAEDLEAAVAEYRGRRRRYGAAP